MPAFILAVPRAPKPLDLKYATSLVDIKRLSSVTLYVPGGASDYIPKRYITTAAVLFLPKALGILPMPCEPSPFACRAQERKYPLSARIQALNLVGIGLGGMVIIYFTHPVN